MALRSAPVGTRRHNAPMVILAVLATVAALYFLQTILIPITLALFLATLLAPATTFLRRILPLSSTGAAAVLFLLSVVLGLYVASLTAESLVQASTRLPTEINSLTGQASRHVTEQLRDRPYLRFILPDPSTIDKLGDRNNQLLYESLSYGLADLSRWVAQGFIVLILVLFLLAESEMLTPKVIRFFARSPGDAARSEETLRHLTHQVRGFLIARTLINLGLGLVFAGFLWAFKIRFAFALGLFAGLTNFVPYVGQLLGGGLPFLVTVAQYESIGDALIVASVYLGLVTIEGYVVTPYILGRSLDLNGTVILIACLFWGFLWGLVGLVLAMPITACLKLVFQTVPDLYRWADLMSRDWQPPSDAPPEDRILPPTTTATTPAPTQV